MFLAFRSRKDKRNIDQLDVGVGSPRRRSSNEIDHRLASRVLEDAALPINSQVLTSPPQDFEVPSMPILRNSVVSLQSRLNQVNLNTPPSLVNFQDFIDAQNSRHQLNNEGVPFSEISTSISNQQLNEYGELCSLDHTRRLNMDFHNGSSEDEVLNATVLKRNTGAIKRTYTVSQGSGSIAPVTTPNYQRNIHSSTPSHISSSNSSSFVETSNMTTKLASVFPSNDSETVFKSSKQQSGQDSSRNFKCSIRRSGLPEDLQNACVSSPTASRLRMHGINETNDHPLYCHREPTEYEDTAIGRSLCLNNSQGSTSSQSSSSQSTSNVDGRGSSASGKNQLKETCFQVRKCPKYQPKAGSILPDASVAAAAVAIAAVSQSSPTHRNVHNPSSMKLQSGSCSQVAFKNNQDFSVPSQM